LQGPGEATRTRDEVVLRVPMGAPLNLRPLLLLSPSETVSCAVHSRCQSFGSGNCEHRVDKIAHRKSKHKTYGEDAKGLFP